MDITKELYIAVSRVYLRELLKRTPKKTGETATQWDINITGKNEISLVNPSGNIILYLEEGTKPHKITPKNKKALSWKNDSGIRVFAKYVNHPGFAAREFIKNLMDDDATFKKFQDTLWKEIEVRFKEKK